MLFRSLVCVNINKTNQQKTFELEKWSFCTSLVFVCFIAMFGSNSYCPGSGESMPSRMWNTYQRCALICSKRDHLCPMTCNVIWNVCNSQYVTIRSWDSCWPERLYEKLVIHDILSWSHAYWDKNIFSRKAQEEALIEIIASNWKLYRIFIEIGNSFIKSKFRIFLIIQNYEEIVRFYPFDFFFWERGVNLYEKDNREIQILF